MSLRVLPTILAPGEAEMAILERLDEGIEKHAQGDVWAAEKVYLAVLREHPGHPRATALMGLLSHIKGEHRRALALFKQATRDDPNDAFVHVNRGAVLFSLGKIADAAEAYLRAAEAWPGNAVAYANLGVALLELFRHEEATYAVTRAVELDPDHYDYGYLRPYALDLASSTTPESALAARRLFNDTHVAPRMVGAPPPLVSRAPKKRLRVGYVSSDFYQHSAIHVFGGLLLNHDPERVEVYCYGSVEKADDITKQLRERVAHYRDINGWSADKLALAVRKDKVDILVDLSTYSKGNHLRMFSRKPAPIQVTGWGYATGAGLDCIDYLMADAITVPPEAEGWYHERIVRLPSVVSWMRPNYLVDVAHVHAAFGRPFTFGVFNRTQKITRECVAAWAEILKRAPTSRLVVKSPQLDHKQVRDALKALFVAEGAYYADGPASPGGKRPTRVAIFGKSPHADQMAAHWPIDLMLDPFPAGGGVSTAEALWMGTPVLTLLGKRMPERIASSLTTACGLGEFVARSRAEYVEKAVRLAHDPAPLIAIRRDLRARVEAAPFAQLRAYAAAVEDAYVEMWGRYLAESAA